MCILQCSQLDKIAVGSKHLHFDGKNILYQFMFQERNNFKDCLKATLNLTFSNSMLTSYQLDNNFPPLNMSNDRRNNIFQKIIKHTGTVYLEY